MELIICLKVDLVLYNLQRLIRLKTQTTNQPYDYFSRGYLESLNVGRRSIL